MAAYTFVVPTVPVAQPRQKHRGVKLRNGRVTSVNYTEREHPVQQFKSDVRLFAATTFKRPPIAGPIILGVTFFFPRPARLNRKKDPPGPVPHLAKPDLDNCIKSVKDALKGVTWVDDAQVCGYERPFKYYAEKGGAPRVEVTVIEFDP